MALIAKCITADPEQSDGFRISIMSRHTQNDGRTPRPELDEMCDEHCPELGPSPKLIGKWMRGEISWKDYSIEYKIEMRANATMIIIKKVIKMARKVNVTVMCIEENPENCHRKIFLEICRSMSPSLETILK